MSISYPSNDVTVLRVPNVGNFRASFVYDFFVPDERTNDSGEAPDSVKLMPAETFDAARIDEISRVVPRFVRFDFTPVRVSSPQGNEFARQPDPSGAGTLLDISDNVSQLQTEETFAAAGMTGLEFQDDNIDTKLFTLVSGSVAKRVSSYNRNIQGQIAAQGQTVISLLTSEHSLLDAAKALAADTSSGVSNNLVVNALDQVRALRLKFIDDARQKEIVSDEFSRLKNVSLRAQFSNAIVGRVVKNVVNDPMSVFSDEFTVINKRAQALQEAYIAQTNPGQIRSDEFETAFIAAETRPVDAHDYPASMQIVGYIIEKSELTEDGQLRSWPPIIIENPAASTAVDLQVAYGKTYVYTVRTVAQLSVRASVENRDEVSLGIGLVESHRSPRSFVNCVEETPPPAPVDFNVTWSYTHDAPLLHWSFPVNTQRDIKKFQVFRRTTILEPFQLVRELDFDDSQIRFPNPETPDPSLVEVLDVPSTNFLDREFTRESRFIYALCSVDAHGLTSNYSIQFDVSFDPFKNRIRKSLVATSGAPKSYPNMTLRQELFTDTIKSSGHTRLRIAFDPEFLELRDRAGNDLGLITFDNRGGGRYRLQIVNTDVMKEEVVDVRIDDMRPTDAKTVHP